MSLVSSSSCWLSLGVLFFLTVFGLSGLLWLVFYSLTFCAGFLVMLYIHGRTCYASWVEETRTMVMPPPSIGSPKLVSDLQQGKQKYKNDKRMTGSSAIDEVLHEVLEYTYRDYIHSWYRRISDDGMFQHDIRLTLQRVVIAFSERVHPQGIDERAKDVDLVTYLTTRLVDDFASHIRLYRKALQQVKEHQNDSTKPPADLESFFFDLEVEMENKMCRDMICNSEESERQYLQDISEVLLFLLLPPDDFHNKPFRYIVREVLVNGIFMKTMDMLSEPDYINQRISWMCKENTFTNETFLTILKTSDSVAELTAVCEKVDLDIARQRAKDGGGDDDTQIKQQLSSLLFVKSSCEARIQRLRDGHYEPDTPISGGVDLTKYMGTAQKLYALPFDVVLNNNVALAFFIEFMTNIGEQSYLFFYHTVECYRVSAEQQISAGLLSDVEADKADLENLREAARSIYQQYLSEKASPRLCLGDALVLLVWEKIQHAAPSDTLFDECQARVWDLLQDDPRFFPAFRRSQLYIKLLAELDLLKEAGAKLGDPSLAMDGDAMSVLSSKSNSLHASREELASSCDSLSSAEAPLVRAPPVTAPSNIQHTLSANISNTGICREHGKQYAVYLISVQRLGTDGSEECWDVCRRYSDFHDLHMSILEKFDSVPGLVLPNKKTFNNMNPDFLEKRKCGLNTYLQVMLDPTLLKDLSGLTELSLNFLEHIHWEREKSQLSRRMDTLVNPFRNSVRNMGNMVKAMPDNFVDGVARMSGGFRSIPNNMLDGVGKILNVKGPPGTIPALKASEMLDSGKVGASLDSEDEDNIPMRILLLLMDEVFDLRDRNQWLRRRIMAILRQIIKTMMGDSINRKIVEYVEWMTSSEQLAEYMRNLRDTFWPEGTLAETHTPRDDSTRMRTRVVCKAKMVGSLSDELRHMIGSENTRHGTIRVFNMFQHQRLNKRLMYVILEGILETLFPEHKFQEVFRKIHSRSPRVKREQKSTSSGVGGSAGSKSGVRQRRR